MTLASVLGEHATWSEPSFDGKKREGMERFGLSSRKFSAAVDAIRKSRPLSAAIGLEWKLRHLTDEKAVETLALWAKAHPVKPHDPDDLGFDYFDRDWGKFDAEMRIARDLDGGVIQLLTSEEFADLQVVFYIGRDRVMGEHYDEYLDRTLAEHRLARSRAELVHHIMTKTNLLDAMVDGAAAVGRPSLAAKLRGIRPG